MAVLSYKRLKGRVFGEKPCLFRPFTEWSIISFHFVKADSLRNSFCRHIPGLLSRNARKSVGDFLRCSSVRDGIVPQRRRGGFLTPQFPPIRSQGSYHWRSCRSLHSGPDSCY